MKRCLVTGASGLIGSRLLRLLSPHWQVHAIGRTAGERLPNVTWQRVDLAAPFDPGELPGDVDTVVYLAQSEAFREFPEKAREIFAVNTDGVLRLLDYARSRGVKRFVFGSSGGLNEEAPVAAGNLGFYLGTKLCSEVLVRNYAPLMSTVVLRFFFVYGAGQKSGMLVPRLVRSVREGTLVTLQGAEGVRLNPTYVSDAAESIARALDLEGSHTINVAGPEELSLRRMCELIGTALGRAPLFEPQPGEPRHLVGDTTKMRALLAAPRVRFADGLRFMLQEGA